VPRGTGGYAKDPAARRAIDQLYQTADTRPIRLSRGPPWKAVRRQIGATMPGRTVAIGTSGVALTSFSRRQFTTVKKASARQTTCRTRG
jgi:hypothetical protein